MRRLTTEEFIEKSRKIHGDKYDYSHVRYVNNRTMVKIICPIHHEFEQVPSSHLQGIGCPECGHEKVWENRGRITTEDFIKRAIEVHGNRYDYSKVDYKNMHTKVCIVCPKHGDFFQMPYVHLNGQGCDKCGDNIVSEKLSMGKDKFIEKVRAVHGDKYDYSKVEYKNNSTKVCIICNRCGKEFWQTPANHLRGQGCKYCAHRSYVYTVDEFINFAKQVHGDKYDYSKVEYINSHTRVCIICPEHGEFWQTPHEHLDGFGCQKCHENRMEREWSMLLDKKGIRYEPHYKNGFGRMSLDFYLPDYKIAIECQGIQHFKPTCFGGENSNIEEKFLQGVKRDIKKFKLCQKNNIKLLYFTNLKYVLKNINLEKDFDGIYYNRIYTKKKSLLEEILK